MCMHLKEGAETTESESSQCCTVKGQEANAQHKKLHLNRNKGEMIFFPYLYISCSSSEILEWVAQRSQSPALKMFKIRRSATVQLPTSADPSVSMRYN